MTAEYRVAKRPRGRVLVDYNQNAWGRTLASIYSVRPRRCATVSTPVTWEEVDRGVAIEDFRLDNVRARIAKSATCGSRCSAKRGRVDLRVAVDLPIARRGAVRSFTGRRGPGVHGGNGDANSTRIVTDPRSSQSRQVSRAVAPRFRAGQESDQRGDYKPLVRQALVLRAALSSGPPKAGRDPVISSIRVPCYASCLRFPLSASDLPKPCRPASFFQHISGAFTLRRRSGHAVFCRLARCTRNPVRVPACARHRSIHRAARAERRPAAAPAGRGAAAVDAQLRPRGAVDHAESLRLVFDTSVTPRWLENSDRFWYAYQTARRPPLLHRRSAQEGEGAALRPREDGRRAHVDHSASRTTRSTCRSRRPVHQERHGVRVRSAGPARTPTSSRRSPRSSPPSSRRREEVATRTSS